MNAAQSRNSEKVCLEGEKELGACTGQATHEILGAWPSNEIRSWKQQKKAVQRCDEISETSSHPENELRLKESMILKRVLYSGRICNYRAVQHPDGQFCKNFGFKTNIFPRHLRCLNNSHDVEDCILKGEQNDTIFAVRKSCVPARGEGSHLKLVVFRMPKWLLSELPLRARIP